MVISHVVVTAVIFGKISNSSLAMIFISLGALYHVRMNAHILQFPNVSAHYGMTKYHLRSETLTVEEMNHTLKIIAPTIAYGTKHMIHFQLCMLPLTMCRYSIAQLSQTNLFRFIPFEDMTQYHIWVGYALVSFVILAFSAFMFYYGIACGSGENSFCEGFS